MIKLFLIFLFAFNIFAHDGDKAKEQERLKPLTFKKKSQLVSKIIKKDDLILKQSKMFIFISNFGVKLNISQSILNLDPKFVKLAVPMFVEFDQELIKTAKNKNFKLGLYVDYINEDNYNKIIKIIENNKWIDFVLLADYSNKTIKKINNDVVLDLNTFLKNQNKTLVFVNDKNFINQYSNVLSIDCKSDLKALQSDKILLSKLDYTKNQTQFGKDVAICLEVSLNHLKPLELWINENMAN